MRHLKSSPESRVVLALLLASIVTVLVLPEVELPATAFYTNTAPTVLHARVSPTRTPLVWVLVLPCSLFLLFWEPRKQCLKPILHSENNFLPILYRCLLC
ncbi:MAG TPA: hypothetical protein VFA68_14415 [Terriglobales bacterium]|nr:hypothetical protein [Terriglobales bacterium]